MIGKVTRTLMAIGIAGLVMGGQAETTGTEALLKWDKLADLPDANGVAGAFAGVSNGALIVGGGANFPAGMPWENGTKVWHDEVYVLPKDAKEWKSGFALPAPRGYGVSVSANEEVICIGGSDADGHYSDVYALKWSGDKVTTRALPALPVPVANAGGALIKDTVYVVGGSDNTSATSALKSLFALNLKDPAAKWKTLEPIPGDGRILPAVGALGGSLYVFSGAALNAGADGKPQRTYLKDAWSYTSDSGWKQLAEMPRPAVAAPVITPDKPGNSSLFVIGGDDGSLVGFEPATEHPGFPAREVTYNTVTNTWADRGTGPVSVVTAPTVPWKGGTLIVSGEVRPGVRTPAVNHVVFESPKASFGIGNYLTLGLYLAFIMGIGVFFSYGNNTSDDYFRGGQKIPWWAAGLSIFATTLSSITFMSVPAKAYSENWVFALANLPILLIAPFIVWVIMPVFRRIDATSAYEYLERRFNLPIRLFGSAAFVLFQMGRMSIVMFLPALALATVTNFDIFTCILLMGVLTVIYCVFGGIAAVIWTDVVQTFVFLGGALITIAYVLFKTDGGIGGFVDIAQANDKFKLINWTWDFTVASFWVIIVGNIFNNLITYSSDQSTIQRYMTTADEGKAARSIWLNALVAIPATILFFMVGTALYVYFAQHPGRLIPGIQNDAVFPLFIARELPVGIAGLLVASIFAAAQSTISTSMNCMSTVIVTDWYERLSTVGPSEHKKLVLARWLTGILGALGTAGAIVMAVVDIRSIWDVFLSLLGLAGGALCGLFLLGIFTKRANGTGAIAGAVVSVAAVVYVQKFTNTHFFLYGMVGIVTCFIAGYLVSLFGKAPANDRLQGLTIFTISREGDGVASNGRLPQTKNLNVME